MQPYQTEVTNRISPRIALRGTASRISFENTVPSREGSPTESPSISKQYIINLSKNERIRKLPLSNVKIGFNPLIEQMAQKEEKEAENEQNLQKAKDKVY